MTRTTKPKVPPQDVENFEWAALNRRMDSIENVVEQQRGNTAVLLEAQLVMRREMNLRFDQVDQRFAAVDKRFNAVDQRLGSVEHEMHEMRKQMQGMGQQIQGMEQQIQGMEQQMQGMGQQIQGMGQQIKGVRQQMQTNHEGLMALLTELVGAKA